MVVDGRGSVDESSITGEAIPIAKQKDDLVCSGTILQNGYLKVGNFSLFFTSKNFEYLC